MNHVIHCTCCGRSYSALQWSGLRLKGNMQLDGTILELRACECGSTRAVVIQEGDE